MAHDPRGFSYALEPLRSKCDWDLQQLRVDLARINDRVHNQIGEVRERETRLASATVEFGRRHNKARIIFADKQQLEHAYLSQQATQLQRAQKMLIELEAERDLVLEKVHKLQKFTDGLEENRDEEIKNYTKVIVKAEIAEADDAWLRGTKWRTTQ